MGFEIDVGPLFQTPEETPSQAVENDVHVIGVSSLAAGYLTLAPALQADLGKLGRSDVMIVGDGVSTYRSPAAVRDGCVCDHLASLRRASSLGSHG